MLTKTALGLVFLAALTGSASAQGMTRCVREGLEVVCRDDKPALDIGAFKFDDSAQAQRQQDAASGNAFNQRVGQMVASGDCDGARKLALSRGDLALAKQVQDVCRPGDRAK